MSTLFDNLDSSGSTYFDDLNGAPSGVSQPSISAVGTLRFQGSAVISGANFGSTQGAGGVTIGGVSQAVTAWSDTSITISPIARGTLKYGTRDVVVTSNANGASPASARAFLPQAGWNYTDLVSPLAPAGVRLTASPDIAGGDQVAYGNVVPSGSVVVNTDGSFIAAGNVGAFDAEVNDGTGWGGFATQFVASVASFSGSLAAGAATIGGSFTVAIASTAKQFSGSLAASGVTMAGTFLVFTGKAFDGLLVSDRATLQGAFSVIGVVAPTPIPPVPSPGGGTPESRVDIVNLGLICLGVTTMLKSFNDNSKAARLATVLYDRVRDQELARHYWKFAIKRMNMAEVVSNDPRGSYQFSYGRPVDWLHTVWIGKDLPGENGSQVSDEDWAHEGALILSNRAAPLPLIYIGRVTDPTKYHVLFSKALSRALAMEMADSLTDDMEKWKKARTEYYEAISEAKKANAIVDPPRQLQSDSWLDARL